MPKYQHFDELPAWQAAARLYNQVLDLFETHSALFTPGYRNQLDRAALSVSNNIAEGFDRVTTAELIAFLGYAKGSAGEVRSMILVIQNRPTLQPIKSALRDIASTADSCVRQIAAWTTQIENGPIQGKRHLTAPEKKKRESQSVQQRYREKFLLGLSPKHPLYNSPEAQAFRQKNQK